MRPMNALKESKSRMSVEIEKRNNTIQMLKNKVNELESALNMCEERAANLQEAVTLYSNSINVLETAKEDTTEQIAQQKITIANLQQALVEAKKEVDEMAKKIQENCNILSKEYKTLQDLNFTLEIEHGDSLQDIDVLENQLNKYKDLCKGNEAQKKKLSKQKKCYEEIICYFRYEMSLMADQLSNLQELLTLSNETAHQETSKIMHAYVEIQTLNNKLSSQLCACEQKVQLENQMNQLHEAKICELQNLLKEKEIDLSKHDQAIFNIRKTLNDSLKQNEALKETIVELNKTINQFQSAINQYEQENCANKKSCIEFQEQVGNYCDKLEELKRSLDEKTAEFLKLEMAYNNEKRALKAAQQQLQETESLQQESHNELSNELENLKHKLTLSIENNNRLCQECEALQNQLANLSRKEAVKDLEIKRYRKIVGDLKVTMTELNSELNKNLIQKELGASCKNSCCRRNVDKEDSKTQEVSLGCPCELESYQRMVEILKKSVIDLKRKLNDTKQRNRSLEDEVNEKNQKLLEIQKAHDELLQNLQQSQLKDEKISELEREIGQLRQDLQVKTFQLNQVKRSVQEISGSKGAQLAFAQEEIASLKTEMTNILNRQYCLKRENEELQAQTAQLHCTISCMNEKNKTFKDQIDQYMIRIRNLNTEKETLLRKNKELLSELRSLQSLTASVDKQQRTAKNRPENPVIICRPNRSRECPVLSSSPYSLDSQGTASYYDGEGSPPSPEYGVNEWYSSTFRSESENDESDEDYCVNTLENLTQQMKRSNKRWMDEKITRQEYRVTKDTKDNIE